MSSDNQGQFSTLVNIITRLRGPDGCPWDKKQTHPSLRKHLLEECYEVLEALDEGDTAKLCQELGDLLLQIVLQAQIAADHGEFRLEDVLKNINDKLIHRHPHIFGSTMAETAEEVAHNWEVLKQEERQGASILATVPKEMPALAYSQAVQRRVAQVGFDWETTEGVIEKLAEEIAEYRREESPERRTEEFGDLMFTLANIALREGVDAESALRQANRKFYRRFSYMEELCRRRGLTFNKLSFAEQNALWDEAKKKYAPRKSG